MPLEIFNPNIAAIHNWLCVSLNATSVADKFTIHVLLLDAA